ncbi:MAG: DHH family phosphoesterase [Lachnospirales bacterium]
MSIIYDKIYETLRKFEDKEIVLVGHKDVDGDAIASTSAFSLFLKQLGIPHKVLLEEKTSYGVLPYLDLLYKGDPLEKCDLFISFDCGDKFRFSEYEHLFDSAKVTINIDHHASNNSFADINLVFVNASSTSEIVYDFISSYVDVTKEMAVFLYGGIVFDTGGFLHVSTSSKTMYVAGKLMETGIDANHIYYCINQMKTIAEVQGLKALINNIHFVYDNKVVYAILSIEDIEAVGSTNNDVGSFVSFLFNIEDVEVAIFMYEKVKGEYKVSLRSKNIDVSEIAGKFGGGGHIRASGCRFIGKPIDNMNSLLDEVEKELNEERNI